MKKFIILLLLTAGFCFTARKANAQSTVQDMQQLILDIEKLTQMKAILSDMKTTYNILTQGYEQVKSISEGNFNLHAGFLNSLMAVSPAVRNYVRVADIIEDQEEIVTEYKSAYNNFSSGGHFSAAELVYLNNVYVQLLTQSLNNLTTLTNILTANTLRMNDAERLKAIDHLYTDTQSKLTFLRNFDNEAEILAIQRQQEQNEANTFQKLF
ncbi:hypothetical protein JN11_03417 [Mucilaginibacter frigoritolerans]|uniref:TerB family tellurite resistance protein n=1 Tax=Mucilaginibacter frigoritolerans TaxID=652788 RepID=A0A562TVM1_9SPHI|nr:TerB family tellurite resistance protein [Mucilaginibacter frigoritolerans]TWI97595.1 hypothetical protein JN11_03417 [Mucilaginibacter frigoritolerans]